MKTKKIYKYVNQLVKPCNWCKGTGINLKAFIGTSCFTCGGSGGKWRTVRILVSEEVIEGK